MFVYFVNQSSAINFIYSKKLILLYMCEKTKKFACIWDREILARRFYCVALRGMYASDFSKRRDFDKKKNTLDNSITYHKTKSRQIDDMAVKIIVSANFCLCHLKNFFKNLLHPHYKTFFATSSHPGPGPVAGFEAFAFTLWV
jgi:hypothetical protein